jgi:hypothetical protein
MDQSLNDHRKIMEAQTEDPASQRKVQAKAFEEEVKVKIYFRAAISGFDNCPYT